MLLLLMPFHFAAIRPFLVPTEQKKQQALCTFSHAEQQRRIALLQNGNILVEKNGKSGSSSAIQSSERSAGKRKSTLEFGE